MLLSETLSWGERFATGGLTTVLGVGITFLVLALLIIILYAISKLNVLVSKKLSEKPAVVQAVQPTVTAAEEVKAENDDAVVAAITAALSVILSEENQTKSLPRAGFIVKKIKRI